MNSGKGDAEKARYWQRTISEAARNGISIRESCRRHRLRESQFYGGNASSRPVGRSGPCGGPALIVKAD